MKAWLSHISHSSFMTPFSQRPIVQLAWKAIGGSSFV
jgi:hypothetical protein